MKPGHRSRGDVPGQLTSALPWPRMVGMTSRSRSLFPARFSAALLVAAAALCTAAQGNPSEPFTFLHITDTHITGAGKFGANLSAIAAEANAMTTPSAFVLASGDLTEMGFAAEYAKYQDLAAAFRMPVHNAMGNHEAKWSDWAKAGTSRFLKQPPWYSFTHGGVRFIALDSSIWLEHHGLLGITQLAWLCEELRQGDMPTVLFYHHCPGFLGDEDQLVRILANHNVRLVLVGHGHGFRTWKRDGIVFQMTKAGMGGKGAYRILEVADGCIRSLTKEVGKDAVLDTTVSLSRPGRPLVHIDEPSDDSVVTGSEVRIRASVADTPTTLGPLVYWIDGTSGTLKRTGDSAEAVCPLPRRPGRHTLRLTSTAVDGSEWTDSRTFRTDPEQREAWRRPVSTLEGAVQRPIAVQGDRAYLGCWGGAVECLARASGGIIWHANAGADVICRPAVSATGNAYVSTTDGRVLAFNDAGKTMWECRPELGAFDSGTSVQLAPLQSSPVLAAGLVLVGGDRAFYAVDQLTGKLRWKFPVGAMIQSRPVTVDNDNAVAFGAWDQTFYCVGVRDGALRWKTHIGELVYFSPANSDPAASGTRIVVCATPWKKPDPDIFCLDAANGNIVWKRRNPGEKSQCGFCSPCISEGKVYVNSLDGMLYCLALENGQEIWRAATGEEAYDNSPVVAGNRAYVGSVSGSVFCFAADTGAPLWEYAVSPSYLFASPAVAGDLLICPGMDGNVTALRR